jgi:hypothetical protein
MLKAKVKGTSVCFESRRSGYWLLNSPDWGNFQAFTRASRTRCILSTIIFLFVATVLNFMIDPSTMVKHHHYPLLSTFLSTRQSCTLTCMNVLSSKLRTKKRQSLSLYNIASSTQPNVHLRTTNM